MTFCLKRGQKTCHFINKEEVHSLAGLLAGNRPKTNYVRHLVKTLYVDCGCFGKVMAIYKKTFN
jgi:hypothetical protein